MRGAPSIRYCVTQDRVLLMQPGQEVPPMPLHHMGLSNIQKGRPTASVLMFVYLSKALTLLIKGTHLSHGEVLEIRS